MLRAACWNVLLLVGALGLAAVVAEAWLRLSMPFGQGRRPAVFVPGVGLHLAAGAELRATNLEDYWTVSRTNSLGFLDREPPGAALARTGCHVAVVGDSFVEAAEVAIADKFHVLLEEMAARRLPGLEVSTAAYGHRGTGQVQQLPYWDKWIRHSLPKLVVLVFVNNDFIDNAIAGRDGLFASAERTEDGVVLRLPGRTRPSAVGGVAGRAWRRIPPALRPYSASWAAVKYRAWRHRVVQAGTRSSGAPPPGSVSSRDMDFTAFALDEWQKRTGGGGGGGWSYCRPTPCAPTGLRVRTSCSST